MFISENNKLPYTNSEVWWSLGKLFFTVITVLFISNFIAVGLALPLVDFNIESMAALVEKPYAYPAYRIVLMQMQGVISVLTFAVAPLLYVKYFDNENVGIVLNKTAEPKVVLIMLTPLIVLSFMPFSSWIVQWNESMQLPAFLKDVEQWASEMEAERKEMTIYLTTFNNFLDFVIALLVMALVPAIGEEILFRGIFQNKMNLLTKNIHIAIWATAFVFSVVHFQFYGFVPRLLLGAMFGYLYHWSGNLIVPILAHFINNGFTLLMMYFYQQKIIAVNLFDENAVPIAAAAFTFFLMVVFMYFFWKMAKEEVVQGE